MEEEENEQLDYDEDELEAARKKAKEIQKEAELVITAAATQQPSTQQPHAQPQTNDEFVKQPEQPTSSLNTISTITAVTSAPRPHTRYYVNPNFNKYRFPHQQHHSTFHHNMSATYRAPAPRYGHRFMTSIYRPNHHHVVQQPVQIIHAIPTAIHQFPQAHHQAQNSQIVYPFGPHHQPHALPVSVQSAATATAVSGNNIYINRNAMTTSNSWDLMVDEFVRKNTSVSRRPDYSRSRSSSRTNSPSVSSSSNSPNRKSRSESPPKDQITRDRRRHRYSRTHMQNQNGSKNSTEKHNRNKVKITHQTIECAKAIGLDEEYLKKIEEQNRLREEVARRKQLHRKENANKTLTETAANVAKATEEDDGMAPIKKRPKIQAPFPTVDGKIASTAEKLRPYLAVVVTNLKGISGVKEKVGQMATSIGPTKKIWRIGSDDCHVIFEKHENAKQFMLQYHRKQMDKTCIDVTMKKVFLNLIPSKT